MKKNFLMCLTLLIVCLLLPGMASANDQDDSLGWRLTGQMGGTTKALLVEGDTLFLGVGLHVQIIDISNPEKMQSIGISPLLPQFVESIASDGKGHLFISCGSGGLVILDVTDPSSPAIAGRLDTLGFTEGLALYGPYAIVADGPQGLQIADISDPQNPVCVSEAYPLAYAYDVSIQGSTAYAAAGGSGLFMVDLSDPESPLEKGFIPLEGFQYDVDVAGRRLFSAGAWGGVSVLDISEPLEPAVAGTIYTSGWAMALQAKDADLLVMDGADGALLYDVSGNQPVFNSACTMGGFLLAGALEEGYAFLLDKEKGLMAADISAPYGPRLVSRWMPVLDGRRVTMSGSAVYVSGGFSGMHVIDLDDQINPVETYWYDTDGGYANKVIVDNKTAYLSSHISTRFPLVAFDISDPLKPKQLGAVPNDEAVFNTAFRSMAFGNGYIYIPGEFCDMSVDVSDPMNPKVAGRIDMPNPINADSSGNLLITTNNFQLQLIDVTDPTQMRMISSLDKNSSGEAVAFINPGAVMTAADPGVWIVDVSSPKSPEKVAELELSGSVMDIFIDGSTAYLSTLGNGIQIVDISDPYAPVLQGGLQTLGVAYDCFVKGDLMLVADSFAGLAVYQRMAASQAADTPAGIGSGINSQPAELPLLLSDNFEPYAAASPEALVKEPGSEISLQVTSAADSGPGSLRECLQNLQANTRITFDIHAFPPKKPAAIQLESPLPEILTDYLTIDASNAGVILDGSKLTEGNGLAIFTSHNTIMGLQILNFPQNGLEVQGESNQIGGNRNMGDGILGQGNLTSGNKLYGIHVGGNNQLVIGNLVGTDSTGTKALPNYDGIFISDWAFYVTVGGINPGEGNVISGNEFINLDTWGDHTRIIGNIFGLDITGAKKVKSATRSNLVMESGATNNTVGGVTPKERNIISGANLGIVFSDPNSYQNSVIGNYIGTDITGRKAVPNETGVLLYTSGNHRVGGAAEGERNVISGNKTGIALNGYGVNDNIILGNWIGTDAGSEKALPNDTGISLNMGQRHTVIGGYTPKEGNVFSGGSISMRISNPGIVDNYIAGNTVLRASVAGVYFEDYASNNFAQNNTFGKMAGSPIRVDYGSGNMIRSNTFNGTPGKLIQLMQMGNMALSAPAAEAVDKYSVSGTALPNCRVEVYAVEKNCVSPIGFADTDENGKFTYQSNRELDGIKIILLMTDASGNTSAFSKIASH